jgi:hypothetical protein
MAVKGELMAVKRFDSEEELGLHLISCNPGAKRAQKISKGKNIFAHPAISLEAKATHGCFNPGPDMRECGANAGSEKAPVKAGRE